MEAPSPAASAALTAALAVIISRSDDAAGRAVPVVFTEPRGVLVGLVNLIVLAPLIAYGVARVSGLDPVFAAGLMLLGAAPGGVFANLLTHLARGATALSVSMTAISSTLAVVTVPFWIGWRSPRSIWRGRSRSTCCRSCCAYSSGSRCRWLLACGSHRDVRRGWRRMSIGWSGSRSSRSRCSW